VLSREGITTYGTDQAVQKCEQ